MLKHLILRKSLKPPFIVYNFETKIWIFFYIAEDCLDVFVDMMNEILTNFSKNKKLGLTNDENRNAVLQQFVAYVVKNLIEKIKILEKSEIIAVTQENIEVMSNIKNIFFLFKNTLDLWEKVKEKSLSPNQNL